MSDLPANTGLFVSAAYALSDAPGGVQRCTREYLDTVQAAGLAVESLTYGIDRRPLTRLRRKLRRRPYADLIAPAFVDEVAAVIRSRKPRWVLFNQIEAAQMAPALADLRGDATHFALLSHGVDSSDYLHTVRVMSPGRERPHAPWLGRQILAEMEMHRHLDVVLCLSETDRVFHQWLGARSVQLVPRIVTSDPLPWHPVPGRIGTIGTLDHAPNLEGITLLCHAIQASGAPLHLRLIGRPESRGRDLAARFSCLEYLGGLTDAAFKAEAATWGAFVNPIFCYARGCSTKLAVPLGWHLPVASTRAGARGYRWDDSIVPLAEDPRELVALAVRLASASDARAAAAALARQSPRLADVAAIVRSALS